MIWHNWLFLGWIFISLNCANDNPHRGEGCGTAVGTTRAVSCNFLMNSTAVKAHGLRPKIQSKRGTGKRSFKRAFLRSLKDGFTTYHGRIFTPQDFNLPLPTSSTQVPSHTRFQSQKPSGATSRLSVFSWNCGGLATDKYQCLQEWLHRNDFDIVCLQETRWKFTNTWQTDRFHAIHSGDTTNHAGILLLLSKRLTTADSITWVEKVAGRLLHVRLRGSTQNLDIIACYQHVHRHTTLQSRTRVWDELQDTLTGIPKRNRICMMGDMNTSLPVANTKVGINGFLHNDRRAEGPHHRDWKHFLNIIERFELTPLNTWTGSHLDQGASRIDYILCRSVHCDQQSKDVKILTHHPLVQLTGCRHYPLVTTMISRWVPHKSRSNFHWNFQNKTEAYKHFKLESEHWSQQMEAITNMVETLDMSEYVDKFDQFHQQINNCIDLQYPCSSSSLTHKLEVPRKIYRQFLHHAETLRQLQGQDVSTILTAWFHCARRSLLRKQMNIQARAVRKQRQRDLLEQARAASEAHDARTFFQIVRKISPKAPKKQISLRSAQGHLLGVEEAADELLSWFMAMYSDNSTDSYKPLDTALRWPFTETEIMRSFRNLSVHKAVSPHYAPAPFWKTLFRLFTLKLHELGEHCQTQGRTPLEWGCSTVIFLTKPSKKADHPSRLRPISLLEPCGKIIMNILGTRMRDQVIDRLVQYPIYAYVPCRGTNDAIRRLIQHCNNIQHHMFMLQHRIHQQAENTEATLCGGLILSLDLSRAFDEVPRSKLYNALFRLGIDATLIQFLQQIYSHTKFEFEFQGEYRCFWASKGIRQGCSAAPTLWALYTLDMLITLGAEVTENWICHFLTLYADDICAHLDFWSEGELKEHLNRLGKLFDVLESYGMTINTDKTAALFKCTGKLKNKITGQHIRRTKEGAFLLIPRGDGTMTPIKLKSSHLYLGIMVSYRNYSSQTINCRIAAARKSLGLLHQWLFGKHGLQRFQKLKLWYQCIFPCLTAGLLATGVDQQTLIQFDVFCLKSIRRIYNQPVHLELDTHQAFLTQHKIRDPLQVLRKLCIKTLHRESNRAQTLSTVDILSSWTPDHLETCLWNIEHCLSSRRHRTGSTVQSAPYQCHICEQVFLTIPGLHEHISKSHHESHGQLRSFRPEVDLHRGLPTCSRCGKHFTSWHALKHHIEYRCLFPVSKVQNQDTSNRRTLLRPFLMNPNSLPQHLPLCKYIATHCIICGQFHYSYTALYTHWKMYHPRLHQHLHTSLKSIQDHIRYKTPCQFCERIFKYSHSCPVIQNMALLRLDLEMTEPVISEEMAHGETDPPEVENVITESRRAPPERKYLFDPLKDQTPPFDCAHCGTSFRVSSALRRHIELGQCRAYDASRVRSLPCGLDTRILQAVRDLMPSTILKNPELLRLMNHQCILCRQDFTRRNELVRHLTQQHATLFQDTRGVAESLADLCRGPQFTCYCLPPRDRPAQRSKHQCVVFTQIALLMRVDDIDFNYSIVQMDQRYAETMEALRNQPPAPMDSRPSGQTLERYFNRIEASNIVDPNLQDQAHLPETVVPPCTTVIQPDTTEDLTAVITDPYQEIGSSPSSDTEATEQLIPDYDHWITETECLTVDFHSENFQLWHWVITADLHEWAPHMKLSSVYSTLYPTTPWKLAGGYYGQYLDDGATVRLLSTRCFLCDAILSTTSQLFIHHQLAHGSLPTWFLQHFPLGLKVLQLHLQTLSLDLSDQDIFKLCQILIFRIHCASLTYDDRNGWIPRDVGHLGKRHPKRSAETVLGVRAITRRRQETQGGQAGDEQQWKVSKRTSQCSSDNDDTTPETRGFSSLPEPGLGICSISQSRPREHLERLDAGQQGLECQQREDGTTTSLSGCQDDSTAAEQIRQDPGSFTGERALEECSQIQLDRSAWEVSVPQLAHGAKEAHHLQNPSFDDGRNKGDDRLHHELHGGSQSYLTLSQSEEAGWRCKSSSAFPLAGVQQGQSGAVAQTPTAITSLLLATYSDEPETRQSAEERICQTIATQKLSVRIFCNSTGKSCYINGACLGLVWTCLMSQDRAVDWSDGGQFLQNCVHPTLVPLDVHHSFRNLLGKWLTSERVQLQHDIHEFAQYLIAQLQPTMFDLTWWPKWSLANGPAEDQNVDDYPRGGKWDILSLALPEVSSTESTDFSIDLQALINLWHDGTGMCNVFTTCSQGQVIHVNRQLDARKSQRPVNIPNSVSIPIAATYNVDTCWKEYSIHAITYHLGQHVVSGHYRSVLLQKDHRNGSVWKDYEDSKVPDLSSQLTAIHSANVVLIWMHLKSHTDPQ